MASDARRKACWKVQSTGEKTNQPSTENKTIDRANATSPRVQELLEQEWITNGLVSAPFRNRQRTQRRSGLVRQGQAG
ncbi:hypothetical protein Dda_5964 [Drechslerella dactyloides]|uniref:Uncharacterized protein n=1 Tax=Drechslerella dactyloides TaxID=74499 RepID=A0AAD6IVD8_DREDA|nr:hypothetical protein Dda_5964 [Drechslerella dactyloides]